MKQRVTKVVIVLLGFLLLASGVIILFDFLGYGIPCLFHEITNLFCPGCGMTRAILSLIEGNVIEAIQNNALIIFLPIIIIYLIFIIIKYIKTGKKISINIKPIYLYSILSIVILFGIIRNIPGFEFLRPLQ